ncbi:Uncharacterized protein BP5553_10598 [Venustampulla echinocandica]|uniref:Major facilitator superfamily (MFS) profile domain-containing protein n=1 Tax=Venustampulla echinocandica TaxID=2656787 RepID=A0A370T920_9HELO|nr:Uncharacterized protein BP5553_10598 [Venustampulla echinocandica]RDL29971.1 Uncharacterized protein BP5553_10598 [Venustampulla echinocandica]
MGSRASQSPSHREPETHSFPELESDVEKSSLELTPPDAITYPEGGGRGWAVALGAAAALFSTFGMANAFGVFQEYYMTHQLSHESPSTVSWIGSIQLFFLFATGIFSGPLFDRYGEKVLWPSAVLYVFSVMMTSICKELWQFMLAQGILGGLSMGMVLGPSMAATGQYFNKKRGAAMGISVAGSSVGAVIFPIALSRMFQIPHIGFGWAVRICGFIMAAVLALACIAIKARLPPKKGKFFMPEAFKDVPYDTTIASVFLMLLGMFIPFFYLPTFAIGEGMSVQLASYLVSILNGASFFGRAIPGILADKFGRFNMLCASALSTGILIFCWPSMKTNAELIVFAALYGFCSGAIVSLMAVCLVQLAPNPQNIGTYYGMGMTVCSIAALIGPPINGALVTKYGGFHEASIFSGTAVILGAVGIAVTKHVTGKGLFAKI